ncbi:hypothetical protein [Microbacterium sp. CR_7]|uniref:hypothetical protein n=1 Tax=Microbacterium sp. CR_7 TaxID=3055792 RepID=UPI0035C02021
MDVTQRQQAEANRALEWLNSRWIGQKICPICGTNNWELGLTSELRTFNGGSLVFGGPGGSVTPIFPVICSNCGLTYTFSAIKTGILRMEDYTDDDTLRAHDDE